MSIVLNEVDGTINVIARMDNAIVFDEDQYSKYLETLDESNLNFVDGKQPTKFIMRKSMPFKLSKNIKNEQMSFRNGEMDINMGYMLEEVRCALVDIENPVSLAEKDHVKWKRENDGATSYKLMELLESAGIVNDLFAARTNALSVKGQDKEELKKK